jgi:hypothetical protein
VSTNVTVSSFDMQSSITVAESVFCVMVGSAVVPLHNLSHFTCSVLHQATSLELLFIQPCHAQLFSRILCCSLQGR